MRYGSFSPNHFPTMNWMPCKHVAFLAGARCVTRSTPLCPICQQIIWFKHIKLYNSADYSHLHINTQTSTGCTDFQESHNQRFIALQSRTRQTLLSSTHRQNGIIIKPAKHVIFTFHHYHHCAEHEHTKIPKSHYIVGTVAIVSLSHSMTFKFKYAKDF